MLKAAWLTISRMDRRPRRWWWSQYLVVGISRAARSGEKSHHRRFFSFSFVFAFHSVSSWAEISPVRLNSGDHPITIKGIDVYLLTRDLPTWNSFSSLFRLIIVVLLFFRVLGFSKNLGEFASKLNGRFSCSRNAWSPMTLRTHWTCSRVIKPHHRTYPKYLSFLLT